MATEQFINKRFRAESLSLIATANDILAEYQTQGLVLTLRQLYYQFVARDLLPNKQSEYKRLGGIISDARLAGLIDWDMMEDRTRFIRGVPTWENPSIAVDQQARRYREDLWADQPQRPEIWIEKDALVGVIERACTDLRIDYFACRGYASQSAQYEAGRRMQGYLGAGQKPVIFHLGDHDPSGIDMTRDNDDRLSMFSYESVDVRRLALNMDQVEQYDPPPNPAKESDIRFADYASKYGTTSWELDALEPRVIDRLIRDSVEGLIDRSKWAAASRVETMNRDLLKKISRNWTAVKDFLK
jgi:hypothetical protein